MLTLASVFLAGLFVTAPAPQAESSQDADERARVGETSIYEFEGDDLEGLVLTAEGTAVRQHRGTHLPSLVQVRRSFLDRLYAHTHEI